ncbi:MAG: nucleotidyltransferase family protein [Clostridia bacterium]|nr:nucleotidyltransferase family protein [Clostridia bacterium]
MLLTGIVAEYNPFHTGHMYHIEKAKRETDADGIIAIMSGSFVQRGEPGVYDKWTRALHAIKGGVDLVLELPAVYALSSAEGFAKGAVETLKATGVCSTLSFGSECGDASLLRRAAFLLETEPPAFRSALQMALKAGHSYAAARKIALSEVDREAASVLTSPNNILASAYLRFWDGDVHSVKREGADYLDTEPKGKFASALALREKLYRGEDISSFVPYETDGLSAVHLLDYAALLLYALRTGADKKPPSVPETVWKRLVKQDGTSVESVLENAKTKQIHMSSIKRAWMQLLIQNDVPQNTKPSYIRVLGFNGRGAEILKQMKKTATLPIITRPAAFKEDCPIWETEKRATDIYFMPKGLVNQDLKRAPIQI